MMTTQKIVLAIVSSILIVSCATTTPRPFQYNRMDSDYFPSFTEMKSSEIVYLLPFLTDIEKKTIDTDNVRINIGLRKLNKLSDDTSQTKLDNNQRVGNYSLISAIVAIGTTALSTVALSPLSNSDIETAIFIIDIPLGATTAILQTIIKTNIKPEIDVSDLQMQTIKDITEKIKENNAELGVILEQMKTSVTAEKTTELYGKYHSLAASTISSLEGFFGKLEYMMMLKDNEPSSAPATGK